MRNRKAYIDFKIPAFGSPMYGRTYSSPSYKYGFNGKEKDDETYGGGNEYDYGKRIYDPRLGRFLSVDGLSHKYPELSTYQYASKVFIKYIHSYIINFLSSRVGIS